MKTTFIYALCEPGTFDVRYVGKSNTPKRRFRTHLRSAYFEDNYKARWIRRLLAEDKKPDMTILVECELPEWEFWEKYYVKTLRDSGFRLTNATEGGDGFGNLSPDLIEKMRQAQLGKTIPREVRDKISFTTRGRGNHFYGKRHSEQARLKMGISRLGNKNAKGAVRSEETKNKM